MNLSEKEYRYLGAREEKEVERAKRDSKDFRPLYERYYGKIFGFLYKRVADEDLAADLASQTFLNALLNLKKYEFRGLSFSAWLYRIAFNLSTDYFRQSKKERVFYMEPERSSELLTEVIEESEEAEVLLMRELKLPSAFEALSAKELSLVELRYFEELPYTEIAYVMNMSEGNARTKMHRILKKMKMLIESNETQSENTL